ncbi:hypothetical protein SESBI_00363 [Sesbania bispinosa]|nr:hypothetical protein SESBI_00363 [Sesbania bispinosa]
MHHCTLLAKSYGRSCLASEKARSGASYFADIQNFLRESSFQWTQALALTLAGGEALCNSSRASTVFTCKGRVQKKR